jgi:TPR repeat protein
VETNYIEMFERAEIAASNGDGEAMARFGWLYRDRKGVAQNYAKAQMWYEKSAAAGNTDAMVSLGAMFQTARDYGALTCELARFGHYSGAIDDLWDDAARVAYQAYIKSHAGAPNPD